MLWISDALMPGPHPLVIGDDLALTEHSDTVEVGDDLDAPADHPGVHRVVVGVQPDVMVARQPGSRPATRGWSNRRQGEHRLTIGADAVGRCAAQHPAGPAVDDVQPALQLVVEIARASEGPAG